MNQVQGAWTFNIITVDTIVPYGNIGAIQKLKTTEVKNVDNVELIELILMTGQSIKTICAIGSYQLLEQFNRTAKTVRFNANINDFIDELDLRDEAKVKEQTEMLKKMELDIIVKAQELKELVESLDDDMKREFLEVRQDEKKLAEFIARAKKMKKN